MMRFAKCGQWPVFFALCFFCFSGSAIYNLETNKEAAPLLSNKHWIFVAEGCHSCDELLSDLQSFCSGSKPPSQNLGFFISGQKRQKMLDKMKHYRSGYQIFSGSPSELYSSYGVQGSPSLLTTVQGKSKKGKVISGKSGILNSLKADKGFCRS